MQGRLKLVKELVFGQEGVLNIGHETVWGDSIKNNELILKDS